MNTFGIDFTLGVGYSIIEQGVRLPMVFETVEAANRHVALLKCGAQLTRAEILDVVADYIAAGA